MKRQTIVAILLVTAIACGTGNAGSIDDRNIKMSAEAAEEKISEEPMGNMESTHAAFNGTDAMPLGQDNQVIVVTSGQVALSNNEFGGDHMKVALNHEDADAHLRKYLLNAPYTYEVNGVVLELYGPAGRLLEFLTLDEFSERF